MWNFGIFVQIWTMRWDLHMASILQVFFFLFLYICWLNRCFIFESNNMFILIICTISCVSSCPQYTFLKPKILLIFISVEFEFHWNKKIYTIFFLSVPKCPLHLVLHECFAAVSIIFWKMTNMFIASEICKLCTNCL